MFHYFECAIIISSSFRYLYTYTSFILFFFFIRNGRWILSFDSVDWLVIVRKNINL